MADSNDTEYPPEDTLGDQGLRGSALVLTDLPAALQLSTAEWHNRVSRVAYGIYLARGKLPGHEIEDWLAAERFLLSQFPPDELEDGDESDGKIT
jgi:hypothetical protein